MSRKNHCEDCKPKTWCAPCKRCDLDESFCIACKYDKSRCKHYSKEDNK